MSDADFKSQLDNVNIGEENSKIDSPISVTLESIDGSIIKHLTDVIAPTVEANGKVVPVPVIYGTAEKWKLVRQNGGNRDPKNDKLQPPLIMIRRSSIHRNSLSNPSNKYLYITHEGKWNARNAYDKWAIANRINPSRQFHQVVVPDYIDLTYEILLWTEFQPQMNHLIEQINFENDEFWGQRNNYKFRVKIENYSDQSELPAEADRLIRNIFTMRVSAYLVPERIVQKYKISNSNNEYYTRKKVIVVVESEWPQANPSASLGYWDKKKNKT